MSVLPDEPSVPVSMCGGMGADDGELKAGAAATPDANLFKAALYGGYYGQPDSKVETQPVNGGGQSASPVTPPVTTPVLSAYAAGCSGGCDWNSGEGEGSANVPQGHPSP